MRRWAALVTNTVFLHGNSAAVNIFADPSASVEHRSDTLQNITVVESGQFIIAKLQCYGCPTTARLEKGGHQITHEENALVCIPFSCFLPDLSASWPFTDVPIRSSSTSAPRATAANSSSTPSQSSLTSRHLHRSFTLPKSPSTSASPLYPLQ
jgi:hypothetical protein